MGKISSVDGYELYNEQTDMEFHYCCGVQEVGLEEFMGTLFPVGKKHNIPVRALRTTLNQYQQAWKSHAKSCNVGNIQVFTSSEGENSLDDIRLITALCSHSIPLGPNPITGNQLTLHIMNVDDLVAKIKSLV